MGYYCWLCSSVTNATTINMFIQHFNYRHAMNSVQKCKASCCQLECARTFDNLHALRIHLKRQHPCDPYPTAVACSEEMLLPAGLLDDAEELMLDCETSENPPLHQARDVTDISFVRDTLNDFIITLKAKNVSQSVVNFTVQGIVDITLAVCQFMRDAVDVDNDSCELYAKKINEIENVVQDSSVVDSVYKLKKYLQDKRGLVAPEEINLGNRTELRPCLPSLVNKPVIDFAAETMQYIPILKTLESVLKNTNQFKLFECAKERDTVINSFTGVALYKLHPLRLIDPNFLQLHFFYDDFETVNPLGSKANIHKLGGLYMCIRNLPESINSQLKYIFPVVYCYSADAKKYGFDKILEPLLSDLKTLEQGVQMNVDGNCITVHGAVVMWSGDNLGIHQLFGFSQNFQADKCCQFCYADRTQRQECFRECELQLRTKSNYELDSLKDSCGKKEAGIVFRSSVANLGTFSIPDNICPDAMHDILEGCLQYELKLVLQHFILSDKDVKLSLSDFNSRMTLFCYGVDQKNKPQPLTNDRLHGTEKKLGMNASQAWCFGRYFCLLIGDLVREDSKHLELVHLLLDIMDIIFAPTVTHDMTYMLEELIAQHHALFCSLFPEHSLIPKQHFLVHYPSKIRQLGPCTQYWCMRFEGKHASAKDFGRVVRNYKNICKSIAWQQQVRHCIDWMSPVDPVRIDVGPGEAVIPYSLNIPDISILSKAQIPLYDEVFVADHVKINGCMYMPGYVVVLNYNEESLPIFGQISYLIIHRQICYLVVQNLITCQYSPHVHAYEVDFSDQYSVLDCSQLLDAHPLSVVLGFGAYGRSKYVVLRYDVLNMSAVL